MCAINNAAQLSLRCHADVAASRCVKPDGVRQTTHTPVHPILHKRSAGRKAQLWIRSSENRKKKTESKLSGRIPWQSRGPVAAGKRDAMYVCMCVCTLWNEPTKRGPATLESQGTGLMKLTSRANLFDWGEFLLALHGQGAQVRLHVLQQFLHRFGTAGRHLWRRLRQKRINLGGRNFKKGLRNAGAHYSLPTHSQQGDIIRR